MSGEAGGESSGNRTLAMILLLMAFVAAAIFALRERDKAEEQKLATGAAALRLVLSPEHGRGLSPADEDALEKALGAAGGVPFEISVALSPLDAVEALDGRADVAIIKLFEYALANHEFGASAVLQVVRAGDSGTYEGAIAVPAGSKARALADLKGRKIAYVDPYSTSGFVFPAKLFSEAGITVEPVFTGSHSAALEALKKGEVAAAATYAGAAEADSGLSILARTPGIPHEPVIVRAGLSPELRAKVVAAFTGLAATPEGARLLGLVADIVGVREITDQAYSAALADLKKTGPSVYQLVPEGRKVDSVRRKFENFR